MKIKVNDDLILSYAIIGNVDNSIEIDENTLPNDFFEKFKPRRYKYANGKVILNESY
ncbi:DUF2977 family protein [Staphylococcus cohnii]